MARDQYDRIICTRCKGRGASLRLDTMQDVPCPSCSGRGFQLEPEETPDMTGIPLNKKQTIGLNLGPDRTPLAHLRALLAQFDDFESNASAFVTLHSPGRDETGGTRELRIEVES